MKKSILSLIVCPTCGNGKLKIEPYNSEGEEIYEGILVCSLCKMWYRIENGIVDLLSLKLRRNDLYSKFADKHKIGLEISKSKSNVPHDRASQISFFKKSFNAYEKSVVDSKYYKTLDAVVFIDWVKRYLKSGDIVLDVGCGTGRQSIQMARQGIKTVGLDISEEMLLLAKRKIENLGLNKCVDLVVGDAIDLPFRANSFNACVFYGTLHHLLDKHIAIARASEKLIKNGLFYSLDPHDSPARFIFDFMMKLWKLYEEETSDNPLLSKKQLSKWFFDAGIKNKIKYSTYLPPHLFYLLSAGINFKLLKLSDLIFNKIPLIKSFGGVIITEGIKDEIVWSVK